MCVLQMTEFHFLNIYIVYLCIHTHTHIPLSVDGHLGCFYILVVLNSAAINIRVQMSFQINIFIFFQLHIQERDCWIAGSYGSSAFYFLLFGCMWHVRS